MRLSSKLIFLTGGSAGIASRSKTRDQTTDDEWNAVFDTYIRSVLHTTRHGLQALKASRGNILNSSSLVGVIGQSMHAAYTATKGAMNTLTKSMALDNAPLGVRVNAVCCTFLVSDAARFVAGHVMPVSGGAELGYRR